MLEKSRISVNRISKVWWPTTVMSKELISRQKEKHYDKRKKTHDKKNNLTAKRITTTSWQKK